MGCWLETCAVSGLPIHDGDKCAMVILDKQCAQFGFETIFGEYSTYGGLNYVIDIHHGSYNGYGWLKEVPSDDNLDTDPRRQQFVIFFLEKVWDYAQALRIAATEIVPDQHILPIDVLLSFRRVLILAQALRRNILGGLAFRGCQRMNYPEHKWLGQLIVKNSNKWIEEFGGDL